MIVRKKKEPEQLHTIVCSTTCAEGLTPLLNAVVAAVLAAAKAPRRGKYRVDCKLTKRYEGGTHRLTIQPDTTEALSFQVSLPGNDEDPGSTIRFLVAVPAASQNEVVFAKIMEAPGLINLPKLAKFAKEQTAKAREHEVARQKRQLRHDLEQLARALELHAVQAKVSISELSAQLETVRAEARLAEVQAAEVRGQLERLK